ncbi:patatin-like phospholipase family protein [candidate division KSB1 bacterium]|nr:patatin-like phospholipase family protein [candidate division KSB1 bacterium]
MRYFHPFFASLLLWQVSIRADEAPASVVREFHLDFAAPDDSHQLLAHREVSRPKIGLALSGGGVRGVAQAGVLKVLEQENIPIDLIVGTSIGGVIGALYASGNSADEIIDLARTIDWRAVLSDAPQRSSLFLGEKQKRGRALLQFRMDHCKPIVPEAYSPGQKLHTLFTELVLNSYCHASNFDQLVIPLKIIATDIKSGAKIILDSGDLAQAMRATVGIPLLFSPIHYDSCALIDGGVVNNIPVTETKAAEADIVIAVDTTSPLRSAEHLNTPWEVADQITTIMQQENNRAQLAAADVTITFDDLEIVSTDYEAIDSLYHEGIRRTRQQMALIVKAIQSRQNQHRTEESFHIDRIVVHGADAQSLSPYVNFNAKEFSTAEIDSLLRSIYASGDVENISAKIVQTDILVLDIHVTFNSIVKSVHFYGNSQFPEDSLAQHFSAILDKPLNPHKTTRALQDIIKMYRRRGLSLAKIDKINYNEHDHAAHINIFEGLVKEIRLSGLAKTQKFVIAREFDIKEGELFRLDRVQDGMRNILATDLFSAVNLRIESESIYHNLNLHFIEKPSHVVRLGARYDSERTAKVFAEFADENMLGTGNNLTFHLQYGGRDFKAALDYRADRIFKTYLMSRFDLHRFETAHFAYTNLNSSGEYIRHATGFNIDLGQQIGRFGTLSGHLRFDEIKLNAVTGTGYDTGSLSINTFGMKTVIDTRDDAPFPKNGKHHIFFYEISSGLVLGADASFFKVMNQLATWTTYNHRHTICPKLVWGTSDATTPYSEQFRLGGQETFYGLREGQLWGKHMILTSLDYRVLLPKFWSFDTYISTRVDLGAMWAKMEEIKTDDFIVGYGAALGIRTPIGPFSFAYGETTRGQRQLYFSAGFDF